MLVALLAGSIAAAVVWRLAENDAADRRRNAAQAVVDSVGRATDDMVVTLSGASALIDGNGEVSSTALDRLASDLAEAGVSRPLAWLTPTADGGWTVRFATGADGDSGALAAGTTIPAGSDLAEAATTVRSTGRPGIGRLDPSAGPGQGGPTNDEARLVVLKPVTRGGGSATSVSGADDVIGVVASVSPTGELAGAIASGLPSDVRYSVSDGRELLAVSSPPPSDGVERTTSVDGRPLSVRVEDDRSVNHDLSWFLLWISAVVVAAAGTVGLRSARYDEDRRRTNALISRTAELAQHLARAATTEDVATVVAEHLPPLLGADLATFGEVDSGSGTIRLHGSDPDPPDRSEGGIFELTAFGDLDRALVDDGIVVLRTPDELDRMLPTGLLQDLLPRASTVAILALDVGDRGTVAAVGIGWRSAPEMDQRMMATLDTVKELSEQTLGRTELTDLVSRHASQLAVLAEQLAGADSVNDAVDTIARLAPGPVGATSVRVGVTGADGSVLHLYSCDGAPPESTTVLAIEDPPGLQECSADPPGEHLAFVEAARSGAPASMTATDGSSTAPVVLPLRADGAVIGSIGFTWAAPRVLGEDLMNDLTTVSEMAAQTLRRAQLVEQLRSNVSRNQALADFAQDLANVRTSEQLCAAVVASAAPAVGASVADIDLAPRPSAKAPTDRRSSPLMSGRLDANPTTPAAECLRTSRTVVVHGTEIETRYGADLRSALSAAGIEQTAHLPLTGPEGGALGVLGVGWGTETELSDTIRAKLRTLGELCSQTVQRVRLAEAEHRLVVSLQERVVRPVPRPPGLVVAERYLPAAEQVGMGGDWFEGIAIDEHRFAVVVGDIAGHGINAIADMVELRAIIGSLLRSSTPLDELYPRVATLLRQASSRMTATSCAAVFDTANDLVQHVSAGHLPPVLGHVGGGTELLLDGRQPLLGVPSGPVGIGTAPFPPGAVMALYTDGIVERRGESIDVSLGRIEHAMDDLLNGAGRGEVLGATGELDLERMADTLLQRCLDGRPTDDDVALVLVGRPLRS